MLGFLRRGPWVLAWLMAGCGLPPADATTIGELGNGVFRYHCTGSNDVVCTDGLSQGSFPECILAGSSFAVDFHAVDSEFHDVEVHSASSRYFSGTTFQFSAERVGKAALVADSDGRVIDMVHLEIVEPTGLGVWLRGSAPPSPLPVEVGQSESLDVIAGAPCGPLGGSLWIDAESSDPSIATAIFTDDGLEITAYAEGNVTVTLRAGALQTTVDVLVVPSDAEPEPPRRITPDTDTDGSATDTDASATDTDTDTDTDGSATDTDTDGSTGG